MGVSGEGKRESVLRVDGDGGQGKGHRSGTELGERKGEVRRKQARGQVRGTGEGDRKDDPWKEQVTGSGEHLRRDKGSGQMRKDQRKGGSTDEIKEVSDSHPQSCSQRVGWGQLRAGGPDSPSSPAGASGPGSLGRQVGGALPVLLQERVFLESKGKVRSQREGTEAKTARMKV